MNKTQVIATVKDKRLKFIIFISALILVFVISILLGILFFNNTLILFLASVTFIAASVLTGVFYSKMKAPLIIRIKEGVIEKCHIEKFERNTMKTASYSLVRKPYSHYYEDSYALSVFVRTNDKILVKRAKNLSFAVCNYFAVGDKVLLISGCLLPLVIDSKDKRSLDPISGSLV